MVSDGVHNEHPGAGVLPETVIVVEDDLLIAKSVSDIVTKLGVRVLGMAQNGEKAVQVASDAKPAAAIVDIRMPGIDGIETARRLWEEHRIPSILLTAYGAEEFVQRASGVPVFGYVLKPPTEENIRASLAVGWANAQKRKRADEEAADLRRTLEHRKLTEKAKWRLVDAGRMTEPEAHLALQRAARSTRRPLTEIAQRVIDAQDPLAALRVPVL
jgi:response regulator NasT